MVSDLLSTYVSFPRLVRGETRCLCLILSVNAPSPNWPLALRPKPPGNPPSSWPSRRSSPAAPVFSPLFGTLPKMIGKSTQLRCGSATAHGESVAACQYTRLKPYERGDRLLSCSPTPCRVPRRSRESLLVSPKTPQQETPQGIQVNGQNGITRDQDAVTGPEEGNMARCVARCGYVFPARKVWDARTWIKRARYNLETRR